jgi:ribosomal protein S12 methylthiotransferase accessory factor YcaO
MLSLAAFRYRNILEEHGGPVVQIASGELLVRGRASALANATLKPGLIHRQALTLFSSTVDGTGIHRHPHVARHIAISEALERWAFSTLVRSDRAEEFGFTIDPSTTGMAAYPGYLPRAARRRAVLEAVERFCLMAWWEGGVEARTFDTDWPGVSAVAIDGPFGGVTVIVYARTSWGGYVYGHAADETFTGACQHAILELARNEWVLRSWWLARLAGESRSPTNVFEQRMLFFGTPEGFELFNARIHRRGTSRMPAADVICDAEVPGPWSEYAGVWRFALRPLSPAYLHGGKEYFFL